MDNKRELRILMIEDSDTDRVLIEHILRKDKLTFVSKCVNTRDGFSDALREFHPDVVLSDHGLLEFNSKEALKICLKLRSTVPFILVTGVVSEEHAISCLHNGADDYVLKSNLPRLPIAIRSAVRKRRIKKIKRKARRRMKRQNEELLEINRELEGFMSDISNSLRGPLSSVLDLLKTTRRIKKNPELGKLHKMMESGIYKLDEQLKGIVSHSKNIRSEVRFDKVNWREIIASVLTDLEYLYADDYLNTFIDIGDGEPFFSDVNRMAMIFENILSSAIIFRDNEREAIIGIEVATCETGAKIVIKDNGIGINFEMLPLVNGVFCHEKEQHRGSGLRLFVVKEILARLNGTIDIASKQGVGTTVTITLPNMRSASQYLARL